MPWNGLVAFLAAGIRRNPRLLRLTKRLAKLADPASVVLLDYPINPRPRWDQNRPHPQLFALMDRERGKYREQLHQFLSLADDLGRIPADAAAPTQPFWRNRWLPALDAIATYGMVALSRPRHFLEVGSGNSTKFARRAIDDHRLGTRITSIDPQPRAEIDAICDQIIRKPAEDVDPATFDVLEANDILFIDSSHRALMNSDVTALFLEVLPRLRPGVLVHVHDIALPFDYSTSWGKHLFSEQYLLAALLLGGVSRFEVVLPNAFICSQPDLHGALSPFTRLDSLRGMGLYGMSFWLKTR